MTRYTVGMRRAIVPSDRAQRATGVHEFVAAPRVVIGNGAVLELAHVVEEFGRSVLLVTGRSSERTRHIEERLQNSRTTLQTLRVLQEPTVDDVRCGVGVAQGGGCDVVVAVGGGSVIDAAKAIAALLANGGDPLDYVEVVGLGRSLTIPSVPVIAVPTTAGTGAEVTKNAVLDVPEYAVKVSLRSRHMIPRVAIVDPQLTVTVPASITATTGLDALAQVLESFVSVAATPLTDALAREAMRRAAVALRRAYENGADIEARRDMCHVSLSGGLCLANAGLGAVHGLAGPLGGMFRAPHGALCAALLPHVMRANIRTLRRANSGADTLARFNEIGQLLTGRHDADADSGIDWVEQLVQAMSIPPLSSYGVGPERFPEIIDKATRSNSMRGNPIELDPAALGNILRAAL